MNYEEKRGVRQQRFRVRMWQMAERKRMLSKAIEVLVGKKRKLPGF